MSAVLRADPRFEAMREEELDAVLEIENAIYEHPWTRGNFTDSLRAGYQCWTYRITSRLLGYFVLIVAAGEAHLLNLSIAANSQRRGYGGALLTESIRISRVTSTDGCQSKLRIILEASEHERITRSD